jgi:hypothetical protein
MLEVGRLLPSGKDSHQLLTGARVRRRVRDAGQVDGLKLSRGSPDQRAQGRIDGREAALEVEHRLRQAGQVEAGS